MKRLIILIVILGLVYSEPVIGQWTKVTQGQFKGLQDVSFADANNGTAVADLSTYRTTDGGHTWSVYPDWNMIWKSYTYVHFLDNQVGWILGYDAGEPGYFFKSIDAGKTWQQVANPVNGLMYKMFWLNATVGYAFGATRGITFRGDTTGTNVGYVWKTTNAGTTWTAAAVGKPRWGFNDMWMQPSGKGILIGGYVMYSTSDFGNSWQKKNFLLQPNEILKKIYFFNEKDGLIFSFKAENDGSYTRLYKTNNGGITWQLWSEISKFYIAFMSPVCVVNVNNIVLSGIYYNSIDTLDYHIKRSIDGGKTWQTELRNFDSNDYMQTIKKFGNTYWGVGAQIWRCDNVPPIFTINIGDSIAYVDSQYTQALKAVDVDGDQLTFRLLGAPQFLSVADSYVKGIPRSTDIGKYVIKVEVSDGKGGKDTLSYNLKVDFATGVEDELSIPTKFSLSQNYPNPFNPSTTISYSVPTSCQVRLTVLDILGREIVTLVNEYKVVGTYEVNFSANNLPSGIYIYRLIAGQFSQTKKMTLIK
ncbi:MAG: T9SS type A sorting domain-containing protein [Patescibacteria group bacterium]